MQQPKVTEPAPVVHGDCVRLERGNLREVVGFSAHGLVLVCPLGGGTVEAVRWGGIREKVERV